MYRQLARVLRAGIANGTYPPGAFLPGSRQLAHDYELSVGTVLRALDSLTADGLIRHVPGRGMVVLGDQGRDGRAKGRPGRDAP